MASNEAAPKRHEAIIICLYPDVCKAPDKPAPFQIIAYYSDMQNVSPNINITGVPATNKNSRIPHVYNNEPGIGGGMGSGVNVGYCRPTKSWASTVNVNEAFLLRHGTEFDMNCCGPEGSANTTGKTAYLSGAPIARVALDGVIQGDTNPPAKANEEEKGWLARKWDQTKELAGKAADKAKELNQEYKITTRAGGAVQGVFGVGQMVAGAFGEAAPTGITQVLGAVAIVHGADDTATGFTQLWTGEAQKTLTEQAATNAATLLGASPDVAEQIGSGVDMVAGGISPGNIEKVAVKQGEKQLLEDLAKQETKDLAKQETKDLAKQETKDLAKQETKDLAKQETKDVTEKELKDETKKVVDAEKDGAQVRGEGGGSNPACKLLAVQIYAQVPEVASRFADIMVDKYGLFVKTVNADGTKGKPYRDPNSNKLVGSWHGHQQQLQQKQKSMRDDINEYDELKCKQPKIPKPLRDLAYYPIPQKPGGSLGYPFTALPK